MLIVLRPFWCGVIVYSMGWDGCCYVCACISGDWGLLCCPIIMVEYEDGGCVCVFFGCHLCPMNGFQCRIVVCGVC